MKLSAKSFHKKMLLLISCTVVIALAAVVGLTVFSYKDSLKEFGGAGYILVPSDNPALTTDVIVGFPGETEEEFEKSRAFVDRVDFYETHIFKYSKRQGTKAAVMENQIPEQIKTARSNIMLEMDEQKRTKYAHRGASLHYYAGVRIFAF